ncbi:MAG: LuxR C-terminal-related transcriptional regulator, partial [Nocardioidaceae bacterium]
LLPLDRAEVAELVRGILHVDVARAVATALQEKTGGIPFVIEEVLRTLLERLPVEVIRDRASALDDLRVPTALRDVVLQRLVRLAQITREVLDLAAVLGATLDPDLISQVCGRTQPEIAAALTEAQTAGLLQPDGEQERFRHSLAQQIVYDAVPIHTRRWLHRRAAHAIEQCPGPKPVVRLAYHYARAGDTAGFVRYAEAAADLAASHGDDATAAKFLLQATRETTDPMDVRLRLAVKLGGAAIESLAHDEAIPVLTGLLTTEHLPAKARGELRFALGRLLRQQGAARDGNEQIEAAVGDLEDEPTLQALALAALVPPETSIDRHIDVHTAYCHRAEQAARRSGAREVELVVGVARASLLVEQGLSEGWVLIERLRRDEALLANPREHARACLNWAQAALHVGHAHRAEQLLVEGRGVAAEAEYLRLSDVIDLVAAGVDWAVGRWDDLDTRVRDLSHTPAQFGGASLDEQLFYAGMLASAGSSSEAIDYTRELIAASEGVGAVWPLLRARTMLARVLMEAGDTAGGIDQAEAALGCAREKGSWVWAADTVVCLVDGLFTLGRRSEANRLVVEVSERFGHVDAPLAQAALLTCQGLCASDERDDGPADVLLESARQVLSDAGLRYDEARASERLGQSRCERVAGGGAEKLEHALRTYGALKARWDIARVCQILRQYGIPVPYPWRGGRAALGSGLSSREREVALLAAAGKTNPEIATELFLSRRTIETHVSNALRKLGCQSRRDLATHLAT